MKFRVNTINKGIVSISNFKKDIHIKIYYKDNYLPVISLYANRIVKYPLEIDFSYDGMPTTIRTEIFKNNLKFDHEGESTKYYKLHLK